jgi:hypothetical protein
MFVVVVGRNFLGLKLLIIGFGKQLKREWQRIIQAIRLLYHRQSHMSSALLLFVDFLVSFETPIYLILRPFLWHQVRLIDDVPFDAIISL